MASDFLGNFPYKKNLNLDLNNFVKKREINIFLLNIKLRPGTTFIKDYFAFFSWTAGMKDGKEEGKAGKESKKNKEASF